MALCRPLEQQLSVHVDTPSTNLFSLKFTILYRLVSALTTYMRISRKRSSLSVQEKARTTYIRGVYLADSCGSGLFDLMR